MQDPLETYITNLLKEKGELDTPESHMELLEKANKQIDLALLEALPQEQIEDLEEAAKTDNVEDGLVEKLLMEAGINPDEVVRNALDSFRDNYLKEDRR